MRYPLSEGTKSEVTLEKEIQFLRDYISLQKIRLGEDYPIHFEIKGNVNDFKISPLLFIPFIENAFKYGISQKEKIAINILFTINDNNILFYCSNEIMNKNNTTSHGIGIKNVISRLDLLYQNKYDLNINETNEVDLMINSLFTIH
jgi:two-component system LytT family sensor kinase